MIASILRSLHRDLLLVAFLVDLLAALLANNAYSTEVLLRSTGGISDNQTLGDTVVTEHGNTYTLQIPKMQNSDSAVLFRTWSRGAGSVTTTVTYPVGVQLSNPVALNTGTGTEVVVLFGFKPESGYRMYRADITDGVGTLTSHLVQHPGDTRSDCMQPVHLSLSAGLREQVAFASDCLVGEFTYAGPPRNIWTKQSFHTVYAGIPPAINSQGVAHFVIRPGPGRDTHVYRASRNNIDISDFVGLSPDVGTPLLSASVNGMVILPNDNILISGSGGYLQINGTIKKVLTSSSGAPWGAGNMVSTADAFYLPRVSRDQLFLERIAFSSAKGTYAAPVPLYVREQFAPSSLNLIYDSDQLRLIHYAQNKLIKHLTNQFDGTPEHDSLELTAIILGEEPEEGATPAPEDVLSLQSLEFPVSLLQAGHHGYLKGFINQDHGTLFSLYTRGSIHSPYQRNLRGTWAQRGADEQQTSSVPAGVEFLLTESVPRAALSCHPVDMAMNNVMATDDWCLVVLQDR